MQKARKRLSHRATIVSHLWKPPLFQGKRLPLHFCTGDPTLKRSQDDHEGNSWETTTEMVMYLREAIEGRNSCVRMPCGNKNLGCITIRNCFQTKGVESGEASNH